MEEKYVSVTRYRLLVHADSISMGLKSCHYVVEGIVLDFVSITTNKVYY